MRTRPKDPSRGRDIFSTEQELADFVASRSIIDQAKGMLMVAYDIDAHTAFELLTWRSQLTNVKVRQIARKLVDDLPTLARGSAPELRSTCDTVLLNAHRGSAHHGVIPPESPTAA